jgi:hypothetical protein
MTTDEGQFLEVKKKANKKFYNNVLDFFWIFLTNKKWNMDW